VACENNERLLHAYLDGELDLVHSVEFEEHLKTCQDCAREFHSQQTMRHSLRAADLYERTPADLRTRIRAALPREVRQAPVLMPRRTVLEWLAVAAVIILAVVFGARVIPNIGDRQQADLLAQQVVNSHIRSLQPGHLFDVQSADQHTVKPWFDGKVDFAPPVINLAEQGFPLVGGRLDYVENRNVAALVYQRQKHLINVFVWPGGSKPVKLPEIQTIQGYNLVCWRDGGMNFCAASDLNLAELRQFVQLLER
jgi:anti-sigma factor RsiW